MCIPHDGLYVFAVRVTGYMAVTFDSRVQCLSRSVVEGSVLASHGLWTRMNLLRVRKGFHSIVVVARHQCQSIALVCSAIRNVDA